MRTYTRACMHTRMCTHMRWQVAGILAICKLSLIKEIRRYMHAYRRTHMHPRMHACTHSRIYAAHTHARTQAHTHARIHTHTHTHVHMHARAYTCVCSSRMRPRTLAYACGWRFGSFMAEQGTIELVVTALRNHPHNTDIQANGRLTTHNATAHTCPAYNASIICGCGV